MVWAVSTDDAEGNAAAALSKITGRQVVAKLALNSQIPNSLSECVWGECDRQCPHGTSAAQRGDTGGRGNAGKYAIGNDCTLDCLINCDRSLQRLLGAYHRRRLTSIKSTLLLP